MDPKNGHKDPKSILHLNSPMPILRLIEKFCESKGIKVDSTESEAQAFHLALIRKYQMLLIGLQIPKVNTMRILNGLTRAKNRTPIILISEAPHKDQPKYTMFKNVVGVIAKPIDVKVLSVYLAECEKPKQLEAAEKEKLVSILKRWETELAHAG